MKFKKEWLQYRWVGNALAICCGVVLYVLLENLGFAFGVIGRLFRFITPVIIGAGVAYVIDPLARFFEHSCFGKIKKWQLRRMLAVILALLLILVLVVTLMVYLVPQLGESISQFVENLDGYSQSLKQYIRNMSDKFSGLSIDPAKVNGWLDDLLNNVVKWVSDNREVILDKGISFGSGLLTFILGVILAIYFLFGKYFLLSGTKRFLRAAMPENRYNGTMNFFNRCNKIMTRYVACDVLDGLIVGVVNGIFMAIMQMPYAVLISVVVGVTNLAPTFGPLVGAVIGGLILLLVNPLYALIFLLFTLVLQTIDGYVIKPKFFGGSLGVSSVVILVFIIVGGRMFGILGVIFSIPIAAIVDFSYRDYILKRLEKKRGISNGAEETPEAESNRAMQEEEEKSKARDEIREIRKQEKEARKEEDKEKGITSKLVDLKGHRQEERKKQDPREDSDDDQDIT